jgi:glycosyltransferase involved in cell wall biosynthesis
MRKLLIVTNAFPPCPAPGSARAWRLYNYLPEFGYETYVVTGSRPDKTQPRVTWVPVPSRNFGERVLRKFVFPFDDDIQWTLPAIRAAGNLIAETPMDAVFSTVPYIQSHVIAYRLKKKFGLPWIADYRDPIVGNPFRRATGIPVMVDRFLDARFFASADLLVAVTDYGRKEWIQRRPEVEGKSTVIWNGYDPAEPIGPKPITSRPYRLVSHVGSLYRGRSPVVPLASALRLLRRGVLDPVRLRFRLMGEFDPEIRNRHRELFAQLTAIGCLDLRCEVPRPQALDAMMESDSLLLVDNNPADIGHTVPAKLFEYIRVGRPILALTVKDSPVERILAISGVRFVTLFPDMEEDAIDARMIEFLNLPTDPVSLSERFLVEFNGRNQARALAGLLDKMLGGPSSGSPVFDEKLVEQTEAV